MKDQEEQTEKTKLVVVGEQTGCPVVYAYGVQEHD